VSHHGQGSPAGSGYRIAVDTGGTFTDVVVADATGNVTFNKALTTSSQMFGGVRQALELVATDLRLDLRALLEQSGLFVYGTTRATNAIVENKTAKTAFLTTRGFPDILTLREGGKLEPFNFTVPSPPPYVPRSLTWEIGGRIDAQGQEVIPLDEESLRDSLTAAAAAQVEAVAVCLVWSLANSDHELRVANAIEEILPGVPYTLSHQLNPIVREYRRASSTCIDASLKPSMQQHLKDIATDLREGGFNGDLLVVTSVAGAMQVDDISARPIFSVNSGPSMAPVAGRSYARADGIGGDLIVCDTGGTTFDVSLVQDDEIKQTRETWLGPVFQGHMTGLSSVDISSIGSGGGSIAWIDDGGLMRVGPQSAGAEPGPACYGRGGTEPTVSDAALALGYLDPDNFLDGRITLDRDGAERAIMSRIGEPLGLGLDEAAAAIVAISNETMVKAIREITINQGVDPRDCWIVAGGGAGGMLAGGLATSIEAAGVLIPRTAGVFSACGAQLSNIVAEFTRSAFTTSGDFDFVEVNETLAEIDAQMDAFAADLPPHLTERTQREYILEARYPYQVWDLEVPLEKSRIQGDEQLAQIVSAFHDAHERTFAIAERESGIECQYLRGRLTAHLPQVSGVTASNDDDGLRQREGSVYFADSGRVTVPIYRGSSLPRSFAAEGPFVVQEPTTTIVVPPGAQLRLSENGNYLIEFEGNR
jgi:N-methylhydantoinase A